MTDVIDFLERMGRDARLRDASRAELERELAVAGIDPVIRAALLDGDRARLEALLGASANVCCLIESPDEEEDQPAREPPPGDQDDEEEDGDAGTSKARSFAAIRVTTTH